MPEALLFFVVAALYASVGHAGASGYLAAMGLVGTAPVVMRPTALVLNVIVAAIASVHFLRAGHFRFRLFWPFAALSIPAAFVGGYLSLPGRAYGIAVGLVLLYAAGRTFRTATGGGGSVAGGPEAPSLPPALPLALAAGAVIGLASGLVGVGGGIFLSPLLLLAGWAGPRQTAAIAAPFILVNSIAALTGRVAEAASLPPELPLWVGAVILGGWLGAAYGSRRAAPPTIRKLLALVLLIAGIKLILL